MREIVFRAYIKKLGKIYDVLQLHAKFPDEDFQRVFINKPVEDGEVKNYRIDGVDNVLMQYTGLKDKNGLQEIYEGDIIDIEGNIKGNYYEKKEVHQGRTDCIVEKLCTKDWRHTEEELIKRGCRYA